MSIANFGLNQCYQAALFGYVAPCQQKMLTSSGKLQIKHTTHRLNIAVNFISTCGRLSKIPALFAVYAKSEKEHAVLLKASNSEQKLFAAHIIDTTDKRSHLLNVSIQKVLEKKRGLMLQVESQKSKEYSLDTGSIVEDLVLFLDREIEE